MLVRKFGWGKIYNNRNMATLIYKNNIEQTMQYYVREHLETKTPFLSCSWHIVSCLTSKQGIRINPWWVDQPNLIWRSVSFDLIQRKKNIEINVCLD